MLPILAVLGVILLLVALRLEHTVATPLPAPSGAFAVGRTSYTWGDSVTDSLAAIPGTKREVVAWIWYPAATGQPGTTVNDYLPEAHRAEVEKVRGPMISKFLTRDLSKVRAHSIGNADVSPQQPPYPVVIMRGGASAGVLNYSSLAEDLASHGYVVVGVDVAYQTHNPELCGGRPDQDRCANKLLSAWTANVAFVLDRLAQLNRLDSAGHFRGRLDMTRVGVFGHSFGGAQAAQFCHDDPRCKAGIDIDGQLFGSVIREGLRQPFMFLLSDHAAASDTVSRRIMANIRSVYDRLPADGRFLVMIRGGNHFFFNDDLALLKSHIVLGTLRMLGVLDIKGRRQLAVTSYCVHTFFDTYLKGANSPPLRIASPQYPEIQALD